jgi:hypothetical protein
MAAEIFRGNVVVRVGGVMMMEIEKREGREGPGSHGREWEDQRSKQGIQRAILILKGVSPWSGGILFFYFGVGIIQTLTGYRPFFCVIRSSAVSQRPNGNIFDGVF